MDALPEVITGREADSGRNSALDGLIAFYRAFNARDLDAIAHNWLDGDEPIMSNPVGGIRRGWPGIRTVYEKLFGGAASVTVEFHDFRAFQEDHLCLFVGRERGVCETASEKLDLAIRTTRLFVERDGRWRQLHHHGSIDEPGLLQNYQLAILGRPPTGSAGMAT